MSRSIKRALCLWLIVLLGFLSGCVEFFEDWFDYDPYEDLPIEEYYAGAEGLTGEELKVFLTELLAKDVNKVTYADAKVALKEADRDPNDSTKVLTIYSRESVPGKWQNGNAGWTREHVWPNSRLGMDRVEENDFNQASDLHNLRAIVQSVNSSRGDKYFDNTTDENSYYPGDEDKGDVARIIFYMAVRYPFLEIVDYDILEYDAYEPNGAKIGILSVLLVWHKEDPVDDFERNRNEVIYKWLNNRNPFIDHPEFADKIFG